MFSLSALVTCRHPSALGTGIMHGCCSFSAAHGVWRTTSCCACACLIAAERRQAPRWLAREWHERPERNGGQDAFFNFPWETQPDIAIQLPRRDESLTSSTLFLQLSIMLLPCRQRCSSPIVTLTLTVDSSFGTWQLFFFLRFSAVRHGGRFRLRTVLFFVADSSCPWFVGRTDGETSLRMPGVLHGSTTSIC